MTRTDYVKPTVAYVSTVVNGNESQTMPSGGF